jgi:hypothetical protein
MSASAKAAKASFTGQKLDWLKCVAADPRIKPRTFEIAFAIMQHVNARTGETMLSDETLGDETGSARRDVYRARKALIDSGWLACRRSKLATVYRPLTRNINRALDLLTLKRDARKERRDKRRLSQRHGPPVAHSKQHDGPPVAQLHEPPVAHPDEPPVARIHLRGNTLGLTPKDYQLPRKELLEGRPPLPELPACLDRRRAVAR